MSESALDEAPGHGSLGHLVPELFFDLISRIPAGVVFLAFLATDPDLVDPPVQLTDINFAMIVAFAFIGYATGLVLNGLGGIVALWLRRWMWWSIARSEAAVHIDLEWFANAQDPHAGCVEQWKLREIDMHARHLHDYLRVCHRDFRGLLPKLAAETALCANLLVAFVGVALMSDDVRRAFAMVAAVLCLIALIFREWSTTQRHCSCLALAHQLTKTAGESTPRTAIAAPRAP